MKVSVSNDALGDLHKSYAFYERQQKGLGSYFRICIAKDLIELEMTAGIHSMIRGYHHVNSQCFQSIIFYSVENGEAEVKAIVDGRMNPSKLDSILKKRS